MGLTCAFCTDLLRWHTNSADKELGTAINDDVDENGKFALGIIIAKRLSKSVCSCRIECSYLVFLAEPPT